MQSWGGGHPGHNPVPWSQQNGRFIDQSLDQHSMASCSRLVKVVQGRLSQFKAGVQKLNQAAISDSGGSCRCVWAWPPWIGTLDLLAQIFAGSVHRFQGCMVVTRGKPQFAKSCLNASPGAISWWVIPISLGFCAYVRYHLCILSTVGYHFLC